MSSGDIADVVGEDFNAEDHKPESGEVQLVPVGWQTLFINKAEVWKSDDGNKASLNLDLTVMDGEHKGRRVWPKITLKSANETDANIGNERLASLAIAFGAPSLRDTSLIIDKVVMGYVIIRPAKGEYKAKNDVKSYKAAPVAGSSVQPQKESKSAEKKEDPAKTAPESKPAAGKGKMPWQK